MQLSRGARERVPGRDARPGVHSPLPVPLARGAAARLRRRDLEHQLEDARSVGLPGRRRDRPDRRRVDVRPLPARRRRREAPARRLAGPPARLRGHDRCRSPGTRSASRSTSSCSRPPRRRSQYGIRLAQNNGQWAARGGAIVALDPKDGSILAMRVVADVRAVRLRGPRDGRRRSRTRGSRRRPAELKNYPSLEPR